MVQIPKSAFDTYREVVADFAITTPRTDDPWQKRTAGDGDTGEHEVDNNASSTNGSTRPLQHTFDPARLEHWLQEHIAGFQGPLRIEQFKGGQSNPTYKLTAASGTYVLRRKPPGPLLPSAHAVEREHRLLTALRDTGVPIPRAHGLCEDADVIGSTFYVMDFVDGRVFWDPRLPDLSRAERAAVFDSMNETIAALHSLDPEAVGLGDYGRAGNFISRQIGRWSKQYRASETEEIRSMDSLIDWLPRHLPAEGETRIVHGDYRLDNVIINPRDPKVVAVLDWELSTLGDPLADFAYHMMSWRIAPDLFRGLAGVDFEGLGIPDEPHYLAAYCRRTGREHIEAWDYYLIFSMFRIAAILQGIAKRALDGTAADAEASQVGRLARPLADQAWRLAQTIAP
ncbi:MAG: phosphotransferase [Hyphomicrobiaceae bacterium]